MTLDAGAGELALVWLVTYLVHSTLLAGGVAILLAAWRRASPALSENLWKLALAGALVTTPLQLSSALADPILTLTLPVSPAAGPAAARSEEKNDAMGTLRPERTRSARFRLLAAAVAREPELAECMARASRRGELRRRLRKDSRDGEPRRVERSLPTLGATAPGVARDAVPPGRAEPASAEGNGARPGGLLSLFALLALAGVLRLLLQARRFRRGVRRCRLVRSGRAREVLDELVTRLGVRREVELLGSSRYPEPVAFGLRRWRIALPGGIEEKLEDAELRALLAHELAHLVRGDTLWLGASRWICGLLAFQPLNFLARRGWRRAAEHRCDSWAVERLGAGRLALARCLTRVAEWRLGRPRWASALAAAGARSGLSRRVERLLEPSGIADPWTAGARRGALVLSLAVVVSALGFVGPRAAAEREPEGRLGEERSEAASRAPQQRPAPRASGRTRAVATEELAELDRELESAQSEIEELCASLGPLAKRPEIEEGLSRVRERLEGVVRRREALLPREGEPRADPSAENRR